MAVTPRDLAEWQLLLKRGRIPQPLQGLRGDFGVRWWLDMLESLTDGVGSDLPGLIVTAAGGVGSVSSVFSRTGVIVAALSDYDASQVDNDSSVVGATVKDALETLAGAGAGSITTLFADTAVITHPTSSTPQVIYTFTIPAGTLADKDFIVITAMGDTATTGAVKIISITQQPLPAGPLRTLISNSPTTAPFGRAWIMRATCTRIADGGGRCVGEMTLEDTLQSTFDVAMAAGDWDVAAGIRIEVRGDLTMATVAEIFYFGMRIDLHKAP